MDESEGSFHTDIEDPDPTLLISHLLTRVLSETILRQPKDDEYDQIGSRGDTFLKYRPLNTREKNVFGLSINLQSCFPSMTVVKSVRSLKLKHPSSFRLNNLSHDFQCIPLTLPPRLHQKCATALVSFFHYCFWYTKTRHNMVW